MRSSYANIVEPCCSSYIQYDHLQRLPAFQREVTHGILEVVSRKPSHDIVPPNRVLDLRATVNDSSRQVQLQWTAPGDDYDVGKELEGSEGHCKASYWSKHF